MQLSPARSVDSAAAGRPERTGWLDAVARRIVLAKLEALRGGALTLIDGQERYAFGERDSAGPDEIVVHVHDPAFYGDLAFGGSIGAAEAYMEGRWSTGQLVDLVALFVRNLDVLDGMEGGSARLVQPLRRLVHAARRNTREGSRSNIAAHYDLGNEFFRLFLDETMMYSSAMFARADMTLHEAQIERLDAICRKLDLKPGDHVLEIGTGWGGFALHAARNYGCKVTTTTISKEQYAWSRAQVARAGLEESIRVLCDDYRDLTGTYDKLVSIEMIEAVGHQYYDAFFRKCAQLLKPEGAMLLQAITIADHRYEAARRSVDFIQKYIFPGSCIPSITALSSAMARSTDLRIFDLHDIGDHYARTLREWRHNFMRELPHVRALGYEEAFIRMWEFYFCYCEGGFMERAISDVQMLIVRSGYRGSIGRFGSAQ